MDDFDIELKKNFLQELKLCWQRLEVILLARERSIQYAFERAIFHFARNLRDSRKAVSFNLLQKKIHPLFLQCGTKTSKWIEPQTLPRKFQIKHYCRITKEVL